MINKVQIINYHYEYIKKQGVITDETLRMWPPSSLIATHSVWTYFLPQVISEDDNKIYLLAKTRLGLNALFK